MMDFFSNLFRSDFMPHGHCYFWRPLLVWLHVSSDSLIALSYFLIPFSLVYLVRKRRDLDFNWMFLLFGVFICSCGLTHLMNVYDTWHSAYRLEGLIKAITAISSLVTAVLLFRLLPEVIMLPSPSMLRREVEERRSAEAEVRRLNADLERRVELRTATLKRANDALQRFAYIASHDLQEPIRTVCSFNQLLAHNFGDRLDKRANEYIEFSVEAAGRMQRLVADLLEYAQTLDPAAARRHEIVDPDDLLIGIQADLHAMLEDANASVTWDDLPLISGDRLQIKQVFLNLITNAVKYSRADAPPVVSISGVRNDDTCTFAVQDNGIGIPPEYFDQIFVAFARLHGKEFPGSGVGLTICKNIIEEHGGRIWVESKPGVGTTFLFTLPAGAQLSLASMSDPENNGFQKAGLAN